VAGGSTLPSVFHARGGDVSPLVRAPYRARRAVPDEKLHAGFPRTLANLRRAICEFPQVLVLDDDDPARPFRRVAVIEHGQGAQFADPTPAWLRSVL